ncbi:MAG TPA: hypothetical protein VI278_00960 [Nitrososphaeraceae archaeon]
MKLLEPIATTTTSCTSIPSTTTLCYGPVSKVVIDNDIEDEFNLYHKAKRFEILLQISVQKNMVSMDIGILRNI